MNSSNLSRLASIDAKRKATSKILVMGVGGAGSNAVNHMHDLGIKDVLFMVCNTDEQALDLSPVEKKIKLGSGNGAGNNPDKGKALAIESLNDIMLELENSEAKMIFITAGMGGGTGTGAAPVVAKAARSKGILSVAIVTLPLVSEGPVRMGQALKGLEELKANTDSIVVIHNENIAKIYGSLPVTEAFHKADDVLATAAKGMAELITRKDFINVDIEDAKTTMTNSGLAVMGSARAKGAGKIEAVVQQALASPLLNQHDIKGAKRILYNISWANDAALTMDEAYGVLKMIQDRASTTVGASEANIIWGAGPNENLEEGEIELTVIATGFEMPGSQQGARRLPDHEEEQPIRELQPEEEMMATKWEFTERYKDIDDKINGPAYFRRGKVLLGASALRSAKPEVDAVVSNPTAKENTSSQPTNGTLFDF